jgi:hypothetical protein
MTKENWFEEKLKDFFLDALDLLKDFNSRVSPDSISVTLDRHPYCKYPSLNI